MANPSTSGKAVFLDRDGTLNHDPGYIRAPDQLTLISGIPEALKRLKSAGFRLIVVTNQSGVARGLIPPDALSQIHNRLNEILRPEQVQIDHFMVCVHHPDENCLCRKPKPQLLLEASQQFQIDLTTSYMVGDRPKDIQAGRLAGCKSSVLVRTGFGSQSEQDLNAGKLSKVGHPDFIADSLVEVADWILG